MNNPKKTWEEFQRDAGSFDKAAKIAFDTYLKKYSHRSNTRDNKEQFSDNFFTPGKIYSFLYVTKSTPGPERPFINRRPVIISMGQMESMGKTYEVGIDLMLVPFLVRVPILESLHKYFGKIIDQNESDIDDGRKGAKALPLNYDLAKKLFYKMGWQRAFQTFDKTKLTAVAIYDYSDWVTTIPLYTKGIEGKQIGHIYDAYIKSITTPTDPVTELSLAAKAAEKASKPKKPKP